MTEQIFAGFLETETDISNLVTQITEEAERKKVSIKRRNSDAVINDSPVSEYTIEICPVYPNNSTTHEEALAVDRICSYAFRNLQMKPAKQVFSGDNEIIYLLIKDKEGKIIGCSGNVIYKHEGRAVNFFQFAAIDEKHHDQGLYSLLAKVRYAIGPADVVCTRTANPKVVGSMEKIADFTGYQHYPGDERAPPWIFGIISNLFFNDKPVSEKIVDPRTLIWKGGYRHRDTGEGHDAKLIYLVKPGVLQ